MLRRVLSLATALGFLVSGLAVAQETTTPPPAAPPPAEPTVVGEAPAAAPAAKEEEKTEEIVVTGTRIKRKDLTTAAPVTVINRDQILASGKVSIGDFLQALPEQGNAINTAVNNGGDGATRVNLRGVGVNRTLVLVNGRRYVPGGTGADGSVDLNSIPTAAVERIELLKDGASAVYGSDAIAGVVNIITRKSGQKTDVSIFSGTSGEGDGTTFDVNFTTGVGGERGNILFSAGYFDQQKVMAGDRGWASVPYFYDAAVGPYSAGSGTIPAGRSLTAGAVPGTPTALWNSLVGESATGSFIWDPGPAGAGTGYNNTDVFCGSGAAGGNQCFRVYQGAGLPEAGDIGDGYNFQPINYLVTPQSRIQLFSTGDVNLADVARGYFEAGYVNRQSRQELAPEPLVADGEGVYATADNVYNPFGTDVYVRRRLEEFGPRAYQQDIDTFRFLAGIDGSLPEATGPLAGWFWDLNFNWGRTTSTDTKTGNLYTPALAASLGPSFVDGTGVARCGTVAAPIDGCVPLNLFGGPNSITADQVSGLTFTGTRRGNNEIRSMQANASGDLFQLLADRPVGLAVGYEYRELSGAFINDPITEKGLTTGNKGLDTEGSYDVNELYAELLVPIVSGLPFAQDIEASAAVRWFDYSTFGSDSTYKLGARWRPFSDVTLRGTYSTAFRAPTIGELYGGQQDNFASVRDPCRGLTATNPGEAVVPGTPLGDTCIAQGVPVGGTGDTSSQLRSRVGGNPDLGAETADIFTVGVVIEPRWVRNLSVTVDYYSMDIAENIGTIGESVILGGCYSGENPGYCQFVVRDASTDFIDTIVNLNANVGKLKTSGIDVSVRYALPTPTLGRFGFSVDAGWLNEIDQTLADGRVVKGKNTFDLNTLNSNGGSGGVFPTWKANLGLTWAKGGLGAGVSTRFISSYHECGDSTGDFSGSGLCYEDDTFQRTVDSYHTEDLFVSYGFGSRAGRTNLMVGVQNLLDEEPAVIYNGFTAMTDPYNYDFMGRFFYVRLAQTY